MNKPKSPWNPLKYLFCVDSAIQEMIYYEWSFYAHPKNCERSDGQQRFVDESPGAVRQPQPQLHIFNTTEDEEDPECFAWDQYRRTRAEFDCSLMVDQLDSWGKALAMDPGNPVYKLHCLGQDSNARTAYKLYTDNLLHKESLTLAQFNVDSALDEYSPPSYILAQKAALEKIIRTKGKILIDDRSRWRRAGQLDADKRHSNGEAEESKVSRRLGEKLVESQKMRRKLNTCETFIDYYRRYCHTPPHVSALDCAKQLALDNAIKRRILHKSHGANAQNVSTRAYKMCDLKAFVEDIIRDFYTIKTRNVLPLKFDAMNDLFNIYALLLLTKLKCTPPAPGDKRRPREALFRILEPRSKFQLDDRGQSQPGDDDAFEERTVQRLALDPQQLKWWNELDGLEKALESSIYAVEKCYLCYRIALLHFRLERFSDASIYGSKIVAVFGQQCGHWVWRFLGLLVVIKTNVILRGCTELRQSLAAGRAIVEHLDEESRKYFAAVQCHLRSVLQEAPTTPAARALRQTRRHGTTGVKRVMPRRVVAAARHDITRRYRHDSSDSASARVTHF